MPVSPSRPEAAIDILHGVTIVDPYRWLEDRRSPATQEWIDHQRCIHDEYFSRTCGLDTIQSRVQKYLNAETVDQPARIGNRLFFRRMAERQEQPCICVRDLETGIERILVDPAEQGPFAAVAIYRISEDGTVLAYALKCGGQRSQELHFVDVNNGRISGGFLEAGITRGLAFASDSSGFYYCQDPEAPSKQSRTHDIRFHRFEEGIENDPLLFSVPRTECSRLLLVSDHVHLGAIFLRESGSEMQLDFYMASRGRDRLWQPVCLGRTPSFSPFLHQGRVYALSFASDSSGEILELRDDGSEGSVLVPPWRAVIRSLHLARERLYVCYEVDCKTLIHSWTWKGEFLGPLPEQPEGTFTLLPSFTGDSDALFFSHESFSKRTSIREYDEVSGCYLPSEVQTEEPEDHPFHVERVTYLARDGTSIPMWLVALAGKDKRECRPTILTGYGGFGLSMTPRFSVLVTVMLGLGCVFALPSIRGGSEFGREWQEAARRRKRQVAYDDFLAAAEWLCANGVTEPRHLAIFGGSNAGLLVGAAMTQRPTLFRAVLCIAPLLDMLRYERFGDARKWREEYGTIDDAEDFNALKAYSPYHRIADKVNYPAILFVTGDKDAQCDAAHVRKMAALLQGREAQRNPILVDYGAERGHSATLPLHVRVDALTKRIAFFCRELGIDPSSGELP